MLPPGSCSWTAVVALQCWDGRLCPFLLKFFGFITVVPTVPCGPWCGGVIIAGCWFPGSNLLNHIAAHIHASPGSMPKNFAAGMNSFYRSFFNFLSCMCKGKPVYVPSLWNFLASPLVTCIPKWSPSPDLARPKWNTPRLDQCSWVGESYWQRSCPENLLVYCVLAALKDHCNFLRSKVFHFSLVSDICI